MELRRYFNLIRRRLALVVVAIIVGGVAGFISTSRTPVYTATATIYVGSTDITGNSSQLYAQAGLNQVVATFAQMIPSPVIAQKALIKTHVHADAGSIAASTTATVVPGTNLIQVAVSDSNSADAVKLANGVAHAFVSQIANYQSGGGTVNTPQGTVPNEPAYVFQNAASASSLSNGVTKKVLLGAGIGLVVSILLILLLDYLDITIKSPEELERRVGLPVLGIVPRFETIPLGMSRTPLGRGHGG